MHFGLKGLCHTICLPFKKLKLFFASSEVQFCYLTLHLNCFLSSVAVDSKDERGFNFFMFENYAYKITLNMINNQGFQ